MSGTRPPQAEVGAPHWVVVQLSGGKYDGPAEVKHAPREHRHNWRRLYRHTSEDLAVAGELRSALAPASAAPADPS